MSTDDSRSKDDRRGNKHYNLHCPAMYNSGRSFESPSFPFRHGYVPAMPRCCSFSSSCFRKNGSAFDRCSTSFGNKSIALSEISFLDIVKVLTGVSSFTRVESESFNFFPKDLCSLFGSVKVIADTLSLQVSKGHVPRFHLMTNDI